MTGGEKIVVGMSGGVDSSMSLVLLKHQGFEPIGLSLRITNSEKEKSSFKIAQKVCQRFGLAHYILNTSEEFRKTVVDYFIKEYKRGRTPNPCVVCNPSFKFKKLFEFAKGKKIKYVATGHYARVRSRQGEYQLLKGRDKSKDQSYYLSFLPQRYLKYIIFPLGNYSKKEVYKLAKKENLNYFDKSSQSQDFCYLAASNIENFLRKKIGRKEGGIVDTQGNVLGKHQGLYFYTVGQRKRIGLANGPYFVKEFDLAKNRLIVTKNKKDLLQKEIILCPYHLIPAIVLRQKTAVQAKTRYGQKLTKAVLLPPRNKKLKLVFNRPVSAVTPGQFCVFYQREVCLGGGIIN